MAFSLDTIVDSSPLITAVASAFLAFITSIYVILLYKGHKRSIRPILFVQTVLMPPDSTWEPSPKDDVEFEVKVENIGQGMAVNGRIKVLLPDEKPYIKKIGRMFPAAPRAVQTYTYPEPGEGIPFRTTVEKANRVAIEIECEDMEGKTYKNKDNIIDLESLQQL